LLISEVLIIVGLYVCYSLREGNGNECRGNGMGTGTMLRERDRSPKESHGNGTNKLFPCKALVCTTPLVSYWEYLNLQKSESQMRLDLHYFIKLFCYGSDHTGCWKYENVSSY